MHGKHAVVELELEDTSAALKLVTWKILKLLKGMKLGFL